MSQIFSRRFDFLFRLAVVAAFVFVAGGIVAWRVISAPAIAAPIEQPIPFSHRHHVGEAGIDCRYCHGSVEAQAYAGMPSTSTCLNCHSRLFADAGLLQPLQASWRSQTPVEWNPLERLPDFVYFNHSIHVAKGIGCYSCHGRVDDMALMSKAHDMTMAWCLDCHRHPERRLRPRSEIFATRPLAVSAAEARDLARDYHLHGTAALTACSTCHR